MSAKVIRCDRCRRRMRAMTGWNTNLIAGLVAGYLCPDCQTVGEDLEAELNLITGRSDMYGVLPGDDPDDFKAFVSVLVNSLVRTYPTPEVMRDKATQLHAARRDPQASEMVRLMRRVADDMESGELWEDSSV